jgi:hypothetical protein
VKVGKLTIDLAAATLWQPVPAWHNRLDFELIHTIVSSHPNFQPAVPLELARQMQQALDRHDEALIAQSARQLAGLGPGLTPAGDDFLMGVLYGVIHVRYSVLGNPYTKWSLCDMTDHGSRITNYCSLITAAAVPYTTALSANLLQAAGRGEASEAWHELMAVQSSEVYHAYHTAISRIVRTGHSSGSDALLGFLLALKSGLPFSRE